jgi:LytS/YehU family sensor histidine kinase
VGILSIGFWISNFFLRYTYVINEHGNYDHNHTFASLVLYLAFPLVAFLTVLLITFLTKRFRLSSRIFFVICTLFPLGGLLVDYFLHGLSLAYLGFVISIMMVYTYIFREKQYIIDSQRNALMLSQINPHFTYNTLSAIAALCDISPAQAKNLTLEFSVYLRHNLTTLSCEDLIPFAQEMNHVDCYLKIEKARFREKLNVAYSIRCKEFNVPPLTIQPIVENAVRHGITKKAGGGTVHIAALSTPKYYVVEGRDDGVGFDPEHMPNDNRVHVGLENVRKRVREMCRGDVQVRSTPGVGTRVTIIIPKKNNKREASS